MKVKVQETEGFRPIDVILSFDNEDDLRAFANLIGKDQTIPSFLMSTCLISQKDRDAVSKVMTSIWESLPQSAQDLTLR